MVSSVLTACLKLISVNTKLNRYVNYGVREIFKDTVAAQYLCNYMTIEVVFSQKRSRLQPISHLIITSKVDGRQVTIPSDTEGIVILNLPSYAGGMNLWGPRREDVIHNHIKNAIICLLTLLFVFKRDIAWCL